MTRHVLMIVSAAALAAALLPAAPAMAQVTYRHGAAPYTYDPFAPDPSPYDQAYGTRPSFQILPTPDGYAPAVRVVERCLYPNGWNVTDFTRDLNGTPPGIEHTCPVTERTRVRARY